MKLLQVLLYYGEKGISRNKLIENLYKAEELADAPNSLRVTSYRLKKMLVNMGLPEHNYIRISKGIYFWNGPMDTEVDVHKFVESYSGSRNGSRRRKADGLSEGSVPYI